MLQGNAIVGQSGGPTAAINASLAGVVAAARQSGQIGSLYGAFNGVEGILRGDVCLLDDVIGGESDLKLLANTPAAALGSCRLRLPPLETAGVGGEAGEQSAAANAADLSDVGLNNAAANSAAAVYEKLFDFFKAHDIRRFFYIGGNDSMDTVAKLAAYSDAKGKGVRVVGIPKTIDNDLAGTDHTPGFGSAAKFVALTAREIIRDCSVYTGASVTIIEIMGRYAGWLTAAASLAALPQDGAAADLIYLPEQAFSPENFIRDVRSALAGKSSVVVAVSEGLRYRDGTFLSSTTVPGNDKFGHLSLSGSGRVLEELVRGKIGCKVRSVELNILQRCASHAASKTDLDEAFAVGYAAVKASEKLFQDGERGQSGIMLAIKRLSDEPYKTEIITVPAASVANAVKYVPGEYINAEGNNVTAACVSYLKPLIMGEPEIEYESGFPRHFVIRRNN